MTFGKGDILINKTKGGHLPIISIIVGVRLKARLGWIGQGIY